jgi:DNA repair protein RadC
MMTGDLTKQKTTKMKRNSSYTNRDTFKTAKRFKLVQEKTTDYLPSVQITTATEAIDTFRKLYDVRADHYREHMFVLYLNRNNRLVGYDHISTGGLTGTVCDPRILLAQALLSAATYMLLCHNHPSGSIRPSRADEEVTQKIKGAAIMFDIKLLDHVIITDDEIHQYFSFAEEGIL